MSTVTEGMRDAWRQATDDHIRKVRANLNVFRIHLLERGMDHDKSKLQEPELSGYAALQDDLNQVAYGTPAYREALQRADYVIAHHYAVNDHHPEHFPEGLEGMNLLQLMELLADWKAASERSPGGSLSRSFQVHRERHGESLILRILERTAKEVGWLDG